MNDEMQIRHDALMNPKNWTFDLILPNLLLKFENEIYSGLYKPGME